MSINIRTFVGVAVLLAGLAVAAPAAATTVIDFTSPVWAGADGQATFAIGPVSLTATGGVLEQFSDSGLGVFAASGDADADEINNIQQITIAFAGPTKIDQFTVSKLFFEGPVGAEYNEVGAYSLDGGATFTQFTAPNANLPFPATTGDLIVPVGVTSVTSIIFQIGNPDPSDTKNDFSVKSVQVTGGRPDTQSFDAPEPATLVLLGSGLLFLARTRRRRTR